MHTISIITEIVGLNIVIIDLFSCPIISGILDDDDNNDNDDDNDDSFLQYGMVEFKFTVSFNENRNFPGNHP